MATLGPDGWDVPPIPAPGGGGSTPPSAIADGNATAPSSTPEAGSSTAYLKQIAEGAGTVTNPSGNPAALPFSATLANGTAVTVGVASVPLPRTVWVNPGSGDTVRIRYRANASAGWTVLYEGTAPAQFKLDTPIAGYEFQRTGGSSADSAYGVA